MGARGAEVHATFKRGIVIAPTAALLDEISLDLERSGIQALAVGIVTPDLHVAAHQHVVSDIAHAEPPAARAFIDSIPVAVALLKVVAGDFQSAAVQVEHATLLDEIAADIHVGTRPQGEIAELVHAPVHGETISIQVEPATHNRNIASPFGIRIQGNPTHSKHLAWNQAIFWVRLSVLVGFGDGDFDIDRRSRNKSGCSRKRGEDSRAAECVCRILRD